jgi:tungstate transport system substrate-binding protein
LGVEQALVDSGLAVRLQRAFGQDTGVAVKLVPGHSAALLAALEQGELDAAMTNAPQQEAALEKQGLAHDRQRIAVGDFVLVGPIEGVGKKARDPAGVMGGKDIAAALAQIAQANAPFISPGNGSGAHLAELTLWRAAKVAPAKPWYFTAPEGTNALALARTNKTYTVVERGLWLAQGGKPLAVLVEGDPRMAGEVHVMRAFRTRHPAAKLFVKWVSGTGGRRAAGDVRGWDAPPR